MMEEEPHMNSILGLADQAQKLAVSALPGLRQQVTAIIDGQCRETKRVERLLDQLLDFAFHEEIREEFRRLCRYWHEHDPEATAYYILAYRDLWDNEANPRADEGEEWIGAQAWLFIAQLKLIGAFVCDLKERSKTTGSKSQNAGPMLHDVPGFFQGVIAFGRAVEFHTRATVFADALKQSPGLAAIHLDFDVDMQGLAVR